MRQLLDSLQTQRLLLSFLHLPLNASGPHPWAVDFFLLWSRAAVHTGRSKEKGPGEGGFPGRVKVIDLSLQPHLVSGLPSLPRKGPGIKVWRKGWARSPWGSLAASRPFSPKAKPEAPNTARNKLGGV